jgi:C-methyltransferase C-terminal domain/Putative zinc binding domain/Methyltransferase domain
MNSFPCRFCGTQLRHRVVDLGMHPPCESFLAEARVDKMEAFYPLHAWVCHECYLVQINDYISAEEIFDEYAYFSSYSTSWLKHAENYVAMITERLNLDSESWVVELASNDGYLLQYFLERGIPCLGIEPAKNVAEVAIAKGVPTDVSYFGVAKARQMAAAGRFADLVCGANVLAQVPQINDFVAGIPIILQPRGVLTIEFPHVMTTIDGNQFDQIYHEHFCYFGLLSAEKIFAGHGMTIFDVEEIPTHGGSLRIYACHTGDETHPVGDRVLALRQRELDAGYADMAMYERFEERVRETKRKLLELLIEAKRAGKTIVGYGAPGKGNTLLNYCGIRQDFLDFTVDRNPYKHGRFTPGTHVPIFAPEKIDEIKPDYILILPWNLKDEIMEQLIHTREWGAQFIVPIPEATVV